MCVYAQLFSPPIDQVFLRIVKARSLYGNIQYIIENNRSFDQQNQFYDWSVNQYIYFAISCNGL
jgi:hypothetical protein